MEIFQVELNPAGNFTSSKEEFYMSMQDPIADMLTRIRNAQMVKKPDVTMPNSKIKVSIATVLKEQGFILDYVVTEHHNNKKDITLILKYYEKRSVIEMIKRVSAPGRRVYMKADEIPKIKGGLGIGVVSTSRGVMTDHQAREKGLGGEIFCEVA